MLDHKFYNVISGTNVLEFLLQNAVTHNGGRKDSCNILGAHLIERISKYKETFEKFISLPCFQQISRQLEPNERSGTRDSPDAWGAIG